MSISKEQIKGAPQDAASRAKDSSSKTFKGKVVSLIGDKLVIRSKDGKMYSYTLAKDAKLTWDGTACNAQDVTIGSNILVTTKKDDRNVATAVESLDTKVEVANCRS